MKLASLLRLLAFATLLAGGWLLAQEPRVPRSVPAGGGKEPPAADSSRADSAAVKDSFLPLGKRPAPRGAFIADLASSGREIWAVGDSGFIAHGVSDTLLRRVEHGHKAALHCAQWWDGALVCAGDSGLVLRVEDGKVRPRRLPGGRVVRALAVRGDVGLVGGDEGLLARSLDGGARWDTLAAPLPMRFHAVCVRGEDWWAGGAGGRLFRSVDQGGSWTLAERFPTAVADLREVPGGLAVLERSGALRVGLPGSWREWEAAPVGEAQRLAPAPGGWAVGGEAGRLALLDTLDGRWTVETLDPPTVLAGLLPWKEGLLASGAWSTLALWHPERPGLERVQVAGRRTGDPEGAGGDSTPRPEVDLAALEAGGSGTLDTNLVAANAPRHFQNVLDTDTRCTTPPTRLRQLERSFNPMRWLPVDGRVMLALDVAATGSLDSIHVLDEWPAGLGLGDQAKRLARSLTFTPGFAKGRMVPSRMLYPVHLPSSREDHEAWARGDASGSQTLDSLLRQQAKPYSPLPPKGLVKAMGFPRRAKRFVWEGAAVVQYDLRGDGTVERPAVAWESEGGYGFGDHAVEVLPKLRMSLPDSLRLAPGDHLKVTQRLRFDRRRYSRPAKAEEEGFRFAEVLAAVEAPDSTRYDPGLEQLEWLLNDFAKPTSGEWPELALELAFRPDGRVGHFTARTTGPGELDLEILRSLAVLFTWGRPAADDTLRMAWRPRVFAADSSNRPASLDRLLDGVLY